MSWKAFTELGDPWTSEIFASGNFLEGIHQQKCGRKVFFLEAESDVKSRCAESSTYIP